MAQSDTRFLSFAFASADLLLELDVAGRITFALGATTGLSDAADHQLAGRSWETLVDAGDRPLVSTLLRSLGVGARCGPIRVRLTTTDPRGEAAHGLFSACRLPGDDHRIACTLSHAPPASASRPTAARHDAETNLLEGEAFGDVAAGIAERAASFTPPPAMMLVELPDLATIRARLPAGVGMELVRTVGSLIQQAAIDGESAGRLSETRFGVIHQGRAERLPSQIAEASRSIDPAGRGLTVRHAEVKLSGRGVDGSDAVSAIRYAVNQFAERGADMPADLATAFEDMVGQTAHAMTWFKELVRTGNFSLAFQPIVAIATGEPRHFEVLSRFEDGKSPFETICFAEKVGIVDTFDMAVCQRALDYLRTADLPGLALSVNVSGHSLQRPAFVASLERLLDAHRDLARRFGLEITESAELTDLAATDRIIQAIRARGFAVALDDFGAGAASFQYLQALTVDFVKIDGGYVRRLGQSRRDDAMLRGIVRLCADLDVGTIAEMVETNEQVRSLQELGVGYAQGWRYGKPTPDPVIPPSAGPPTASTLALRRKGAREVWG